MLGGRSSLDNHATVVEWLVKMPKNRGDKRIQVKRWERGVKQREKCIRLG